MKPDFPAKALIATLIISATILATACTTARNQASANKADCQPSTACTPCAKCDAETDGSKTKADLPHVQGSARPLQQSDWSALPDWEADSTEEAWKAFLRSCSVLSRQSHWQEVCATATAVGDQTSNEAARSFFEAHLIPWKAVNPEGTDLGLVTGYYEPLIKGSRFRSGSYQWPIYARPSDMLTVDLGSVYPEFKSLRLRGQMADGRIVPYWTRAEIDSRGEELGLVPIMWAADPVDLFFLHVQGSGQVELPDGSRIRLGYADQNGHPYRSIGRWLVDQGELTLDQASMQSIKSWVNEHPERLTELLSVNPSYIFYRELPNEGSGPIGALSVPLTAERSIAVDPSYIPLGAPVYISTTYPLSSLPLRRLVLAQDTGSAIKGTVRADFFWGFGEEAGTRAGRMRQQGQMWVLLPRGWKP